MRSPAPLLGVFDHPSLSGSTPSVLQLGSVHIVQFQCMKMIPARLMIQNALASGSLAAGGTVIETSSGTFALALATVCNEFGLRCIIVCDPAIDQRLERRLRDLACEIAIVQRPASVGGYQQARLDLLAKLLSQHEGAYWPNQYGNPDNPLAYRKLADAIVDYFGTQIALVATVGSGGSSGGTGRRLREHSSHIPVIAVDTFNSVLFGLGDGPRLLRGLGNSLIPGNVDYPLYDQVHFVDAATAFSATRMLHRSHALFSGPTTGAAWLVANWVADRFPDRRVIAIGPDDGHRYLDTVYNDDWIREVVKDVPLPAVPLEATALSVCSPPWAAFNWARRQRNLVTGDARVAAQ